MRNSVEHHVKRRNQDKLCKASLGSSVCSFVAYSILPLSHKTCHFTNVSLYRWVVGPVYALNQKKTIFFPIRDLTFSLIQLPHPTPRLLRRSPPPTAPIPNLRRPPRSFYFPRLDLAPPSPPTPIPTLSHLDSVPMLH